MENSQIEELKLKLDNLKIRAGIPIVRKGNGKLDDSKFGGKPWLNPGEEYPCCSNCGQPMPLVLQVNLDRIPSSLMGAFGGGILQFFYCQNTVYCRHDTGLYSTTAEECQALMGNYDLIKERVKDMLTNEPLGVSADFKDGIYKIVVTETLKDCVSECGSWSPFSEGQLVRIVHPIGLGSDFDLPPIEYALPPHTIVDWQEVEDFPSGGECKWDLDVELDDEELDILHEDLLHDGHKIGGWATWVQSSEYPGCPTCDRLMDRLLFQVDIDDDLNLMWGDAGTGYIFQCPEHHDRVAFLWQCC
jgi:uncharacterized protein YwqG